MIEVLIAIAVILLLRNRVKAAIYQRQKEDFWREVFRVVEQKKKLDELYGRDRKDD